MTPYCFRRHQRNTTTAITIETDSQRLAGSGPTSDVCSGLTDHPGWLAIPFLLLASVCGTAPERGREASLDLQGLGGRAAHVSRELPKVDAGWNLSFESHVANSAAAIARNLATTRRESLHEGWAR